MEPNDNNINHKASMAEQQQFRRRMLPRLAPPTPPGIHRGGNADSTLAPSSSNFHPLTLPNSATSYNGADATHEYACPLAFRLRVEVARLEMELRKKDMEIAEKDARIKFFEDVLQLTSSSTPSLERASNTSNLNEHLNFSLEELQGRKFLRMATSKDEYETLKKWIHQHGNNNLEMLNFIFEDLKGYIPKLCHNSYGSQVMVQLLKLGHSEKNRQVFKLVLPELVNLCCDPNGTVVIQKLVDRDESDDADPEQTNELFCALKGQLLQLSLNGNAYKVIERCIETFPNDWHKYFMDTLLENCMTLGTDKHGCCVLQKCVQFSGTARARHRLVEEILQNVLHYSKHFYGNYVVQCVVIVKQDYADRATEILKGNFVAMSMHKFSSNVVEKILNNASIEKVRDIVNEIIEDPNRPNNIFDVIAKLIENNYSTLDCHMYGKRVVLCLIRLKNERRSYSLASLEEPSNV
ncbi:hypothetical protein Syun_011328 [Stephania yunnanensis]|uniref:PUM-HD domain-containing protein n=1 Tax=Stephania yunnanensis TaxID=152371 RepID=A0AAP0JXB7_9MAGN